MENDKLLQLSKHIRKNILRAILNSKASHIASALSVVDILTVLYGGKYADPAKIQFFLSKGHAGISVYATLNAIGVITDAMFDSYYMNGSYLGGHVSHKNVPGVFLSTGSLGGGIAVANGVALANRLNHNPDKIYVIVGDGECQEGSIWEACLFASHHKLANLTVIIDRNGLQGCGTDSQILSLDNLDSKFSAFGFQVLNVDGHDFKQISQALDTDTVQPKCIIASTIKGRGVDFMENNNLWHYRNVSEDDYEQALSQLDLMDGIL